MSEHRELAETIQTVVVSGMKPKEVIAAVRRRYPNASKKAIVRAAFYALTSGATVSADKARDLHEFALSERGSSEDDGPAPKSAKKKRH